MVQKLCALLIASTLCLVGRDRPRVFLMSFDGLGHERLTTDPAAEPLTALRGLLRTGAWADGLMPAYPSTTANGHAALWTGAYVGRNGILYNNTPIRPRAEHTFAERVVGFRSDALTAEPIWLAAARQGMSVVSHQATQVYPFLPQSVGSRPYPKLLVANGFQSRTFAPWRAVRAGAEGVRRVECAAEGRACFEWSAGPARFRAVVVDGGMRVANAAGGPEVEVRAHAEESEVPVRRALARFWSAGLEVRGVPEDGPAFVAFRLFSVSADGSEFDLLETPVQEMAVYSGSGADPVLAREMLRQTGPVVGNAAPDLWRRDEFGKKALDGGSGSAERRFLETLELTVRQQIAEIEWLVRRRDPDLVTTYLASVDDLDHLWYGLDRMGKPRYGEFRRWGFAAVNRAAEALLAMAAAKDHVVVTSDHGMAPVEWLVSVNRVLQKAGLQVIDAKRQVVAEKSKALAYSTCVLLNTADWKSGVVPPAEREQVLDQVDAALRGVLGADGEPVISRVYRSKKEMAFFGHDGPAGADLCFDMRARYGPGESGDGEVVQRARGGAVGSHGFDPNRADMKAILLVRGPRAGKGVSLGAQRSASVAALVADLLGIEAPRDSAFRSPLRGR